LFVIIWIGRARRKANLPHIQFGSPEGWESRPHIRAFLEKLLPLDRVTLLVSGRVSFEIMLKERDANNNLVASAKWR
jgi:hypothetical protein